MNTGSRRASRRQSGSNPATDSRTSLSVVPRKRGFYEKVTDVNISFLFFFRWGLCFSFRLRRMLFSTVFLYALCMSLEALCRLGSYGEVEAASFESASLRA